MGRAPPNSSSSSSIDSSSHPSISTASSPSQSSIRRSDDLSTDLRLGLDISTSLQRDGHQYHSSNLSEVQASDWPPIKALLRSTLEVAIAEKGKRRHRSTFFVKVYMDGIPIGRKLDLFALHNYHALITTLAHMFRTTIQFPDIDGVVVHSDDQEHVLTYEDKEGDWMMVGDVPWELFLTTVKKLKISRADKC